MAEISPGRCAERQVDGPADVAFDITTWMVGSDAAKVPVRVSGKLFSPPARITSQPAVGVELTGELSDQVLEGVIVFPISNEGGTTVRELGATVTLPSDLPAGVSVTAPDDAAGWSCTRAGDVLDCTLAEISRTRRGAAPVPVPLVLGVSAPDLDLAASKPLVELAWAGGIELVVDGVAPVVGPLSVISAPEHLDVSLAVAAPEPGAPRDLTVSIDNLGGTTSGPVTARLTGLADGMAWPVPTGSGWTACAAPRTNDRCRTLTGIRALDRDVTELRLTVPPGKVAPGTYPIELTVLDANGATIGTDSIDVEVIRVSAPGVDPVEVTAPVTVGKADDSLLGAAPAASPSMAPSMV